MFPKRSIFFLVGQLLGSFHYFLKKGPTCAFSQFSVFGTVGSSWSKPAFLSCDFCPCFVGVWIPAGGL